MSTEKTTLILKCTARCNVYLDGDYLTFLNQSSVKKVTIDSGEHLLEFKSGCATSTKVIHANPGCNLVIFDEELQETLDIINKPVTLFGSKEKEEELIDGVFAY